jgi:hypothetical protein
MMRSSSTPFFTLGRRKRAILREGDRTAKENTHAYYGTCVRQHAGGLCRRQFGLRCEAQLGRRQSGSAVLRRRREGLRWRRLLLSQRQPEALEEVTKRLRSEAP